MLLDKSTPKSTDEADIRMSGKTASQPALKLVPEKGKFQKREIPSDDNRRLYPRCPWKICDRRNRHHHAYN